MAEIAGIAVLGAITEQIVAAVAIDQTVDTCIVLLVAEQQQCVTRVDRDLTVQCRMTGLVTITELGWSLPRFAL